MLKTSDFFFVALTKALHVNLPCTENEAVNISHHGKVCDPLLLWFICIWVLEEVEELHLFYSF